MLNDSFTATVVSLGILLAVQVYVLASVSCILGNVRIDSTRDDPIDSVIADCSTLTKSTLVRSDTSGVLHVIEGVGNPSAIHLYTATSVSLTILSFGDSTITTGTVN